MPASVVPSSTICSDTETVSKHAKGRENLMYSTSRQYSIGDPEIAFFFGPKSGSIAPAASGIPINGILDADILLL